MIAVRLEIGAGPDTRVTAEQGLVGKRTSAPLQAGEALR
jgi:hypothetical protein